MCPQGKDGGKIIRVLSKREGGREVNCRFFSQNCHGGHPEAWNRCGARHGVECDMLDFGWRHFPDSPFGDVDICVHGVCRMHGTKDDKCKWCG